MTPPRKILILSDGRAGHLSTSRGMAALLASVAPCEIETLEVRLRLKAMRIPLRWLVNSGLACRTGIAPSLKKFCYQGYRERPADVVISTGGDTLHLNVMEGHCRGRINFFCGSLRGVDPHLLALVVHTRAADLENWQAMEVLPSAISVEKAERAASDLANTRLAGRAAGFWSILIGGDGNGYRYDDRDIMTLIEGAATLAARHGKSLLLTTSRRTGSAIERLIMDWLDRHPKAPVAYTVCFGHRPEKVAAAYMQLGEMIFCTEESTSMISEAVLYRRPVVALAPVKADPVPDHQSFLAVLEERGRIFRIGIDRLASLDPASIGAQWQPYDGADHEDLRARMLNALDRDKDRAAS